MLNYYHRHLPNLAGLLEPLHKLLRKSSTWTWTREQLSSFTKAKELLCSSHLLVHYDPEKPLLLSCDASPYGVGAVLSHLMSDAAERPIAYASRTLTPAERNYSQLEKEGLAVVFTVKKFHQYLYGRKVTIMTDHKPLLGLLGADKAVPALAAARIHRWALLLSGYNYELRYRSGESNANADCMSRLPQPSEESSSIRSEVMLVQVVNSPVTAKEVKEHTRRDPVLGRVLDFVSDGWPEENSSADQWHAFRLRKDELSIEDGCVLWGNRVIIPTSLQTLVLKELHVSYPGICRMKALARSYVWWPNMDRVIAESVKECKPCQEHQNMPAKAPLHPWENITQPWTRLHIDFAGPFLGRVFLIMVDAY